MRITLNIEDALLTKAARLIGVKEKTAMVRLGLEALICRESGKRLAVLGGTQQNWGQVLQSRIAGAMVPTWHVTSGGNFLMRSITSPARAMSNFE